MLRALTLLALLILAPMRADAQTLKLLTAGAFKPVALELIPAFEARTGIKVEVQNDTAGALTRRVESGEAFDVVIVPTPNLETLARKGKVDPASVTPLAKVGIGVAVRAGSPRPPLETVEQFKEAVLNAHKVAYIDPASGGSSGIYLDKLFQRLGIAEAVRAKAVLVAGGHSAERVVSGEADLAIQQISELLPVSGVTVVGPLPEAVQNYTVYGSGISSGSRMTDAARSFVGAVVAHATDEVVRAKGMLPAR